MAASSSAAAAAGGSSSSATGDANKTPCGHQFHWPCINNRKYGLPGGASPSTAVGAKCSCRCGKDNSDGHSVCAECVVQRIRYGHPGDICPVCRASFAWARGGSSVGLSYVAHIAKWLGGHTSLTLIYRASHDGTTYDDLLRCVGDKTGLVFVVRKDRYVFGAFISAGIQLPDDPTSCHEDGCHVWHFSLAGHFPQPTKMDGTYQRVTVAGREGSAWGGVGASVVIGGLLWLSDNGRGSGRPTTDIRSCHQYIWSHNLPAGYTGQWGSETVYAVLGGSVCFHADELEVLHVGG
ncbi:unnamed protein product [Vitrella brassicaformis CCMP3155]|uniref:TLDc domain-containing protein n=1 Tax=Vitrella brassicaformis (strain CCMP3155) TaxID=1169540 RepID=A0A0G4EUM1_VITBC|nr:unnamed protein product [Vitrella brassicaformis CCMP3155]|eukprot:CEM02010.1 unnamed protein product [Vitrella brassicaformis CCMP3155]